MPNEENKERAFKSGLVNLVIPIIQQLDYSPNLYISTENGRAWIRFSSGAGKCDNPECGKPDHRYGAGDGIVIESFPSLFQRIFRNYSDFKVHYCYSCAGYHVAMPKRNGIRHHNNENNSST